MLTLMHTCMGNHTLDRTCTFTHSRVCSSEIFYSDFSCLDLPRRGSPEAKPCSLLIWNVNRQEGIIEYWVWKVRQCENFTVPVLFLIAAAALGSLLCERMNPQMKLISMSAQKADASQTVRSLCRENFHFNWNTSLKKHLLMTELSHKFAWLYCGKVGEKKVPYDEKIYFFLPSDWFLKCKQKGRNTVCMMFQV